MAVLVVGGRDLTRFAAQLTWSNVDPGGYEACAFGFQGPERFTPTVGDRVDVYSGCEPVWSGTVNEVGRRGTGDKLAVNVVCIGPAARLKDRSMREIYVDRDVSRWTTTSNARKLTRNSAGYTARDWSASPDPSAGVGPGLSAIDAGVIEKWWYEALYDSGGIPLLQVRLAARSVIGLGDGDASFQNNAYFGNDATFANANGYNLKSTTGPQQITPGVSTSTGTAGSPDDAAHTACALAWLYTVSGAGVQSTPYGVILYGPAVIGRHGLDIKGPTEYEAGVSASEVAADALRRGPVSVNAGVFNARDFIVGHLAYLTWTPCYDVVADMARLTGSSWGVWRSLADPSWRLDFGMPPSVPTAWIGLRDCHDVDPPKARLDNAYDSAIVNYTDAAGSVGSVTVTIDNPLARAVDQQGRVITLDSGLASADAATVFGYWALQLLAYAARGGGSVTLPSTVQTAAGGKPAEMLRSGQDRLRITDLPDDGQLLSPDLHLDTFHVRRVETAVQPDGTLQTRVEFDGGADLMEVITARKAVADVVAGVR